VQWRWPDTSVPTDDTCTPLQRTVGASVQLVLLVDSRKDFVKFLDRLWAGTADRLPTNAVGHVEPTATDAAAPLLPFRQSDWQDTHARATWSGYAAGSTGSRREGQHMHTIAEFGSGQVLWDMLWFFMFFIWIWLLIMVFGDVFRSHDMSGLAKAIWIAFIIILPYLGVLVYLIARGSKMQEHAIEAAKAQDAAARQYIHTVSGSTSSAEEIARLADLRDKGILDETEFQVAKAKALA
jgi:hypothetical protein